MATSRTFSATTGAELHYATHGEGAPVLALHGAFSTHGELAAAVEPAFASAAEHRRLYPDLPGMGETPAHGSVRSANDVIDLLEELITAEIGAEPFRVIGQSYGAHLARGIAARHPDQVSGLALICPMVLDARAEEHIVVQHDGDPTTTISAEHLEDYQSYFVIQTPSTAARFVEAVVPSLGRWDSEAVETLMSDSMLVPDPDDCTYAGPTLVVTGRHDSLVGFRDQLRLIEHYPAGTHIIVADAGHALPHEHPALTDRVLGDWLQRTRSGSPG